MMRNYDEKPDENYDEKPNEIMMKSFDKCGK